MGDHHEWRKIGFPTLISHTGDQNLFNMLNKDSNWEAIQQMECGDSSRVSGDGSRSEWWWRLMARGSGGNDNTVGGGSDCRGRWGVDTDVSLSVASA
ncbi:hypothetical protein M0R45_005650 [Rubus argutus]|uniref:Uncharacterized protein n=1 Tax=Rubus argutus TaxID=59490 RepID=A0AAW1YN98_RUBAR